MPDPEERAADSALQAGLEAARDDGVLLVRVGIVSRLPDGAVVVRLVDGPRKIRATVSRAGKVETESFVLDALPSDPPRKCPWCHDAAGNRITP